MEIPPLTEWEKRERDGLLALETPEWREKRLVAEDPNTTADVLVRLANEIEAGMRSQSKSVRGCSLTADAIVAHPNTPPQHLILLLDRFALLCVRGFCHNPIAPFLLLEMPDFYECLALYSCGHMCEYLLCQENLPPNAVIALTRHSNNSVAQSARLHIAFAGEIKTRSDGVEAINSYWRAFCHNPPVLPFLHGYFRRFTTQEWHAELVALRLAPSWAAKLPLPTLTERFLIRRVLLQNLISWGGIESIVRMRRFTLSEYLRQSFVVAVRQQLYYATEFTKFTANLHGIFSLHELLCMGCSLVSSRLRTEPNWIGRLNAALKLPLTSDPFNIAPDPYGDLYNRSPFDLLNHLARDGNRLVRWAAQTRLADPDFVFTWQDDE